MKRVERKPRVERVRMIRDEDDAAEILPKKRIRRVERVKKPIKEAPNEAPDETGVLDLLQQVRSGKVTGKQLPVASRRMIVSLLAAEGYSGPEIAKVLGVSDRTIERDRQAIRESLALQRDPKFVEQTAGRVANEAELVIQRMRRVAREKDVSPAVRVDAEHRCMQVLIESVRSLQSLGYLPQAAQRLQAELMHGVALLPTMDDLSTEVDRLAKIGESGGVSKQQIAELREIPERALLTAKVDDVKDRIHANKRES